MIHQLEALGFSNFHTTQMGPCDRCTQQLLTYYLPEEKRWLCEACYYANPENIEFLSYMVGEVSRINMATPTDIQALMARMQALESRNAELEAVQKQQQANVYISRNGNLTLKFRKQAPRSWIIPSKRDGQAYVRGAEIPCFLNLDPTGTKIIFHAELPTDATEAQLFRERFVIQTTVIAQKAQQTQDGGTTSQATTSTPTYIPPTPTLVSATVPVVPAGYDMDTLVAEADGLVKQGIYKSLQEAVSGVKKARGIK